MNTHHIFNLKRQKPDARDFKLSLVLAPHEAVKLPISVDLRHSCPPIFDQGQLGSCTANAGCAAFAMLKKTNTVYSRLYQYFQERKIEGQINNDSGANMRDIGKALSIYGVCEESLDPYIISNFKKAPSIKANSNAKKNKVSGYYAVLGVDGIKNVLALKSQPVLIGFDVYESFESNSVATTGIMPMPKSKEQLLGGHAVLAVGYDDNKKWLIMRNSWGTNWGDKGYFYMPYDYVNIKKAYDFWALQ